jgi:hypothetical protein
LEEQTMSTVHPLYRVSQQAITLDRDLRGQPLLDTSGLRIGHVHDVLVEEQSDEEVGALGAHMRPRFLEVGSGGRHVWLGRERLALIPVAEVAIEPAGIRVRASRHDIFGPDLPLTASPKTFDVHS